MTNDEGMLTNDEARMTRLRQATAWQANDEGMLINDEVQMTRLRQATAWQANDEGMTKSEAKSQVPPMIRSGMRMQNGLSAKSRRRNAFTIWKSAQRGSAKRLSILREKSREGRSRIESLASWSEL